MTATSTTEAMVREFVAEFNMPATRRLLNAAICGSITWEEAETIARNALANALEEVKRDA